MKLQRRKADVDRESPIPEIVDGASTNGTIQYTMPHPIWPSEYLDDVKFTHRNPNGILDHLAYNTIQLIRFNFDWMSGYSWRVLTEDIWLTRIIFLETIAGVPGSVAGTLRHLRSLRNLKRDHGWIHTLYEEAENERMHLLTALHLLERPVGKLMKTMVFLSQGIFFNFFWISYLISPRFCHRIVGYLEEQAVATYTHCLSEIDKGHLPKWSTQIAPEIAREYWKLPETATVRDVIAMIRADEAHHRLVNHTFASIQPDSDNPFPPGH